MFSYAWHVRLRHAESTGKKRERKRKKRKQTGKGERNIFSEAMKIDCLAGGGPWKSN